LSMRGMLSPMFFRWGDGSMLGWREDSAGMTPGI